MLLSGFSLLSLAALSHATSQSVLGFKQSTTTTANAQSPYAVSCDDGLFTPVEHLSALSADSFTTLDHPYFPNYSVRIKKSNFCDATVKSVDIHILLVTRKLTHHARALPALTQDILTSKLDTSSSTSSRVAMILRRTTSSSGPTVVRSSLRCRARCRVTSRIGPGCSSSMGLFMELGPCRALSGNGTTFHPESWNTNANIFFVDQPIGVGFSYADYGEDVVCSMFGGHGFPACLTPSPIEHD